VTTIRRGSALPAVLALLSTGLSLVVVTAVPAHAAWTVPAFVRSIGGHGRPGVFPWGVQYNPVSNEVIVGDYLNNQVRRYTPDGKLLGSFFRPKATGQPHSIAVDPRNGDIYVPEIADGSVSDRVAHYTRDGTYVRELRLPGIDYQAWITIDGRGRLYQADSHYKNTVTNPPAVRVWRLSDGAQVRSFDVMPPGTTGTTVPRIYGIDVDSAGNIWLTDTFNNRILKYASDGTLAARYAGGFHGDARGLALDEAHDRMFVSDPTVGVVKVFDLRGQFLEDLGGGVGEGPQDLGAARQPAVAPDGSLYVADYGNARVHRFTPGGEDAGYFPRPDQPAVPGQLGQPRDVDVDDRTGDVWVADSWNQRFQKFRSTGEFAGTWGTRGASRAYGMNYPRGIGIDPVSRRVWVANQRGHHIKRYEYDGTYVDTLGSAKDSTDPGFFRWPLDVEFHGGRAMVTDRLSPLVKLLTAQSGAETGTITRIGNHGGAIDPDTGHLYISTGTRIFEYDPTGTTLIRRFGSSGTGDGQFRHIWDLVVSNGVVYATDDRLSRIQAFATSDGSFLGKWGGLGTGAYQFNNPSGIAADSAGLLYVADAHNDRVLVFDPSRARGGGGWPPPDVTLAHPAAGATVPGAPVRFAGTVTDETAVASVQVAVQDRSTGQWFDPTNSTWNDRQTWAISPLAGATSTSMSWAWSFVGLEYAGRYTVLVRAVDVAGNSSSVRSADFEVAPEPPLSTTSREHGYELRTPDASGITTTGGLRASKVTNRGTERGTRWSVSMRAVFSER